MKNLEGKKVTLTLKWENDSAPFCIDVLIRKVQDGKVSFEPDVSSSCPGLTLAKQAETNPNLFCPVVVSFRES